MIISSEHKSLQKHILILHIILQHISWNELNRNYIMTQTTCIVHQITVDILFCTWSWYGWCRRLVEAAGDKDKVTWHHLDLDGRQTMMKNMNSCVRRFPKFLFALFQCRITRPRGLRLALPIADACNYICKCSRWRDYVRNRKKKAKLTQIEVLLAALIQKNLNKSTWNSQKLT